MDYQISKESKDYLSFLRNIKEPKEFIIMDKTFTILPNVFLPGKVTEFFVENLPVKDNDSFLEIGTGHGVIPILIQQKTRKIVATDISPDCVNCAKLNVDKNELKEKIDVREGNLFDPINNDEKFNVIFWYVPIHGAKPEDVLEMSITDFNHESLDKFLQFSKSHLAEDGFLCIGYGDNGDVEVVENLISKNNYKIIEIKKLFRNGFNRLLYILQPENYL